MDGFLLKKILHKVIRSKLQDVFIALTPVVLLIVLISVKIVDENVVTSLKKNALLPITFSVPNPSPYPQVNYTKDNGELTAGAFVVLDNDSKVVMYSKNKTSSFPMASTTKLMTALVSLDYYKIDDIIVVPNKEVAGVVVGFPPDERVYFKDLLYGLLLPSGNDAAIALAYNYPGGIDKFVAQMNKKAQEFHLSKTFFKDSTGLSEDNTTTPLELARLASEALKNNMIALVVSTKHTTITNVDKTNTYSLTSLNKLLGIDGVNGVKTGFTDEAGEVLVTSRLKNGHTTVIVVMKSKDRFLDTQNLLSVLSSIEYVTFPSIHP